MARPAAPMSVQVYRTAVSSISVPTPEGRPVLYPVVAVWADLSAMRSAGVVMSSGVVGSTAAVVMDAAFVDPDDLAVTTVVVSQPPPARKGRTADAVASPEVGGEAVTDQDFGARGPALNAGDSLRAVDGLPHAFVAAGVRPSSAFLPPRSWALRLPTTWVALATAMSDTPWMVRMVLIDGFPPGSPEHHVLTFGEAALAVVPDRAAMSRALEGVMGREWTMRTSITAAEDPRLPVLPVNSIRDDMWAVLAGVALGHEHAFNRLLSFGTWLEVDPGARADAMVAADWLFDSSMLEPLKRDGSGAVIWPEPMRALAGRLDSEVLGVALDAVGNGHTLEAMQDAFGVASTMVALGVAAAARAHGASAGALGAGVQESRFSTAYLLGVWLDAEADIPLWATRATHRLLMHHDTSVLVDLLSSHGAHVDRCSPDHMIAQRFFHTVVDALWSLGMSSEQVASALAGLDFTPSNVDDIVFVTDRLLRATRAAAMSHRGECMSCLSIGSIVEDVPDQSRLIRAMAAVLPLLADLSANRAGFPVGDDEWIAHRDQYLKHWLSRTAVHPSAAA